MSEKSVVQWLLDSDPSIRWQVLRDLTDAGTSMVLQERAQVEQTGWGAALLSQQTADGTWLGDDFTMMITLYSLAVLKDMGIDPSSAHVKHAISRIAQNLRWDMHDGRAFFDGEVEPCINGAILATGAYFGVESKHLVQLLLSEQLEDGGWNCDAPGSRRSSFHTTICVLEGLLEYENAFGGQKEITAARERAEEYLLDRQLFRRLSTGEVIDKAWTRFRFPPSWHYDVLRGLDYMRSAGRKPEGRMQEAIDMVKKRRHQNGRWPLVKPHDEVQIPFQMETQTGAASRWNTLRAMRVLLWYESGKRVHV